MKKEDLLEELKRFISSQRNYSQSALERAEEINGVSIESVQERCYNYGVTAGMNRVLNDLNFELRFKLDV